MCHSHHGTALGRYRCALVSGGSHWILPIRNNKLFKMCEWLSHGEWCDVKLLCGGRSFSAHRAVLASVSTFLRQILLSCPVDETPTFIVLPDFDLEALSSVLFYIYNGEVVLHKQKVGFFLDIIQAMQIYIDCQYLPKIRELAEDGYLRFNSCNDASKLKTEIFTLACGHDKDQRFINIKRGTEAQSVLLQNSQRDTDFHDNVVRSQNESELRRSRLGNLKLPCGDRQRNSFLRDLFIETYPRNGNVNGLTESVLAISNEYYRPPASVLSANANGEHLLNGRLLQGFCTKTTRQTLDVSALIHSEQQQQYSKQCHGNFESNTKRNTTFPCIKHSTDSRDLTFIHSKSETVAELHNDRVPLLPHQLGENSVLYKLSTVPLNFQKSFLDAMKCHLFKNAQCTVEQNFPWKCGDAEKGSRCGPNTKVIFNQVLDNPWSPRMPNSYKPLRRKCQNSAVEKFTMDKSFVINDSNNNQTTTTGDAENLSANISFEPPEDKSPLAISDGQACFKCTHCDQVFTTAESLSIHMRRHSTTARYTCGDCGKTFSQLRNFKYHMSIHRGTREFAATCTVCGKYFNDRGYLSSHMKIHRNRKEYKCTLCPKSFNQRVAYNMHVRIHTGIKPHVCSECGKAFSRKMLLKQHQRTHSGERPYACPHCDKRFADRSNMTLHLRLHTGIKPHVCSECGKAFSRKMLLKQHQRTHSGERPYACPHCDKRFADRSNMTLHLRLHTGVKPFSCTLCPKSFTKKHHLKSHLNFHTGSKPYSCPRCKLAFTQSSNMRTHYKKCNAPDPVESTAISMHDSGTDSQSHL